MLNRPTGHRSRGQALAEFALVFPVFMLMLAAIIQFGIIFWGQNTLTQIVRDTGRVAASQTKCVSNAGDVIDAAKSVAASSALIGYPPQAGGWNSSNVIVEWRLDPAGTINHGNGPERNCPPRSNSATAWVKVTITHTVPVFFPLVPGNGNLTSSAEFRMEPLE